MKIVQVLHKGSFNTGSVHQMFQLSKGLRDLGHKVIILGRDRTEVQERAKKEGIEYVSMPFKNEFDFLTLYKILCFLKREKPDIVHLHKGLELTLFWVASYHFKDLNLVANRGVSFPLRFYNSIKYKSKKVKAIICVCDYIREIVIKSGKINGEKVFTVYAGTDTEEFDPKREDGNSLREELGFSREDEILCQVGIREWRGWKTAIDTFYLVKKERPEAKLLLVGAKDENLIKEVKEYGKKFNIGKEMVVLGYRKDNVRVAAAQTISLDLSYEGVGITGTLREALAMEKPVVASDVGGNRELVMDGEVGFLVPPRDPRSASEAILKLLKDRDLRVSFGKKGRKRVEENFSSRIRISKIEKIYKEILNSY